MTIGAGQLAAAADILALQDGMAGSHRCEVVQTVTQSFASGSTVSVLFDTELSDADGWHSTSSNTDRVTPNKAGTYLVIGALHFAAATTTTSVHALVAKNGTAVDPSHRHKPANANQLSTSEVVATVQVNGSTDYISLLGVQVDSGAAARGTAVFSAQRCYLHVIFLHS